MAVEELHRVPGEWRCLQCGARIQADGEERPACPGGCEKACVPLTWKRYGPELQQQRDTATAQAGSLANMLAERDREAEGLRSRIAFLERWFGPALAAAALLGALAGVLVSMAGR